MSASYGTNSAPAQRAGRPGQQVRQDIPRPATLTATVAASVAAAVFGLAGAVVTFTAGRSMLRNTVEGALGSKTFGAAGGLVSAMIDQAYKTLQSRATVAVVVALVLGALAFAARGGKTSARIGLTIGLLVAAVVWVLNVRDGGVPGLIRGLDGVALFCSLAGVAAAWLPANGRFAKDRKALMRN